MQRSVNATQSRPRLEPNHLVSNKPSNSAFSTADPYHFQTGWSVTLKKLSYSGQESIDSFPAGFYNCSRQTWSIEHRSKTKSGPGILTCCLGGYTWLCLVKKENTTWLFWRLSVEFLYFWFLMFSGDNIATLKWFDVSVYVSSNCWYVTARCV